MRLTNFRVDGGSRRVGLICGGLVVDAQQALRQLGIGVKNGPTAGDDTTPSVFASAGRLSAAAAELEALDPESLAQSHGAVPVDDVVMLAPVVRPPKILCIGLNYHDHVQELGLQTPVRPHVFSKLPTALTGPFSPIVYPQGVADRIDYEAELAVVVGTRMRFASEQQAMRGVFGYSVVNDVSARDWQFAPDDQLTLGKGFDTFFPMGPSLVTADEIPDPQALAIRCRVNGELRQNGSTAEMVFPVAEILARLSRICTLEVGDIVATGTPAGVAAGRGDDFYLTPGDVVESDIEGIGTIRNEVVLPTAIPH